MSTKTASTALPTLATACYATILTMFSQFQPILPTFTISNHFDHILPFWPFFTILIISHHFDHFSPFWPFVTILTISHHFDHFSKSLKIIFFFVFFQQKIIKYVKVDGKLSEKLNWLPSRAVLIFGHPLWTRFSRSFGWICHKFKMTKWLNKNHYWFWQLFLGGSKTINQDV